MSATMARQGGRVQLEQSNMRVRFNMAKMAKGGFSCTPMEQTHFLIIKPHTKVQEEQIPGVELPGHNKVKAAI